MTGYFSEVFNVSSETIENYGAYNISLVSDLPLFIDPFLLFNSDKKEYQQLHEGMIKYLQFLKQKSVVGQSLPPGLISAWYKFPEIKQTWLGYSIGDNNGNGLGKEFAEALHTNLYNIFRNFGAEVVTQGSHLEKLCLVKEGVGKDHISDFTTNLIIDFLLEYTETFAKQYINSNQRKKITISKAVFNYKTEIWERKSYELPFSNGDFVVLTPKDILTKDNTWINKKDLIEDFDDIPDAIPNAELRAQINNYFLKQLPKKEKEKDPTKKEKALAAFATIQQFPELIDYYIKRKEQTGDRAVSISSEKIVYAETLFNEHSIELRHLLSTTTKFYETPSHTYEESRKKALFLKDVIENKGGHKIFYVKGKPIKRESDLHVMYRLVWHESPSDVSREVNDGRGPADYKISRGATDKTIVEFKLASNTHLEQNLLKQAEIYQKASDAPHALKVITYFTPEELARVNDILKRVGLENHKDIILIDARDDNKPSASKA